MTGTNFEKFDLLDQLSADDRERVVEELEGGEVAAGSALFREGEASDGIVWLEAGRVRVKREGLEQAAELGAGEAVGTLSLVVDGRREATAETLSRARVWQLRRGGYERLVATAPRTACRLVEAILRAHADAVRRELRRGEPVLGNRSG